MSNQVSSKHGGARKYGRNKTKCEHYRAAKTREHNKSRRILQSNGVNACVAYCQTWGIHLPKRFTMEK